MNFFSEMDYTIIRLIFVYIFITYNKKKMLKLIFIFRAGTQFEYVNINGRLADATNFIEWKIFFFIEHQNES